MGKFIIPVIFLVIAVGAVVFRDRLSSNAADLVAGDCFMVPALETIEDVQHNPCTDPHDGEVLYTGDFEAGSVFPSDTQFDSWVQANCVDQRFAEFVGASFQAREDIDLGYFTPTAEGWGEGDRQMICYLTPTTGEMGTSSFRAAPAAS